MLTLDRYLLRQIATRFAVVVIVVVAVMSIENTGRLAAAVETTDAPLPLLMDLMASLLPDYFASAIPVATYLAPALAFPSWALRGEWQMSDALGLSPVRVMLAPVALAVLATGAPLAVRLEL